MRRPRLLFCGAFVTTPLNPWDDVPAIPADRVSINVHPPKETKRPIGYAPWPKKRKRRKKRSGK